MERPKGVHAMFAISRCETLVRFLHYSCFDFGASSIVFLGNVPQSCVEPGIHVFISSNILSPGRSFCVSSNPTTGDLHFMLTTNSRNGITALSFSQPGYVVTLKDKEDATQYLDRTKMGVKTKDIAVANNLQDRYTPTFCFMYVLSSRATKVI